MGYINMAELKLVINDPKTGKSYAKSSDIDLAGNKIGDKIQGDHLGLKGYELQITGGSDTAGFPMRSDIETSGRKRALLTFGPGVSRKKLKKKKGARIRKTVRGNTISNLIAQVNMKIVKHGSEDIEKSLGIEKKEEAKKEN